MCATYLRPSALETLETLRMLDRAPPRDATTEITIGGRPINMTALEGVAEAMPTGTHGLLWPKVLFIQERVVERTYEVAYVQAAVQPEPQVYFRAAASNNDDVMELNSASPASAALTPTPASIEAPASTPAPASILAPAPPPVPAPDPKVEQLRRLANLATRRNQDVNMQTMPIVDDDVDPADVELLHELRQPAINRVALSALEEKLFQLVHQDVSFRSIRKYIFTCLTQRSTYWWDDGGAKRARNRLHLN
jgi:hypothetical protein